MLHYGNFRLKTPFTLDQPLWLPLVSTETTFSVELYLFWPAWPVELSLALGAAKGDGVPPWRVVFSQGPAPEGDGSGPWPRCSPGTYI